MALPFSPGDIVEIAKLALRLYKACQAAPDQFAAVGREASGMRLILCSIKMYVLDKNDSILKAGNKKDGAELLQQLKEHTGRCLSSLKQLEELLNRYQRTEALGWLKWLAKGKAEVAEVQAQMESSTTQLNTFCKDVITVWGLAVVNENVKNVDAKVKNIDAIHAKVTNIEKLIKGMGLDVIEDALGRHPDNEKKAIKEVMGVIGSSSSREDDKEYKTLIQEYAAEVKKCRKADGQGKRDQTPEGRGRNDNDGQLGVLNTDKRPYSAEPGKKDREKKDAPAKKAKTKAPSFTFECWLVKSFSAERKKQNRGQEQLKDMAEKFQASKSCLDENHSLVRSVLDDKNRDEDTRYKWYYCASRVERVERGEQIMVIVKRRLTREALEKQDEKERKEAAKKRKEKEKEEDRKKKEEAKQKEEASEKKRTQDGVEGKQGDGKDRKKKEETKKKEEASKKKKEDQDGVGKAHVEGKQGDGKHQPKKEKEKEETKKKEEASKRKKEDQDGVGKAHVEGKQRDRKDQPKKEQKEKEEDRKKKEETKKKEEASKKKKENQDGVSK